MVQLKYAIVDFFERDEVDIVETRHIQTRLGRERMNGEKWDKKEEVQIPWPTRATSGKKQTKYVARILKFGDDKQELSTYMEAVIEGREIPINGEFEYGRGKRYKQQKRSPISSDSESEANIEVTPTDRQQTKKKKVTHRSVEDDTREQLRSEIANVSNESTEVDKLKKQVQELKEENRSLRNALKLINGIPDLIEKVELLQSTLLVQDSRNSRTPSSPSSRDPPGVLSSQTLPRPSISTLPRPSTSTLPRPSTPTLPRPSTPTGSRPSTPTLTPTHGRLRRVFDYDVNEDGKVDLGHGISVNSHNLQYVSRANPIKTTYTLCEVVFTREELSRSSLTGKKSNAFMTNESKPRLSENGVASIIDFVLRMYPTEDERTIRKTIGRKLNIMQKLEKRKC